MRSAGAEITFITRVHTGNMDETISKRGYRVYSLPLFINGYLEKDDDLIHVSWLRQSRL